VLRRLVSENEFLSLPKLGEPGYPTDLTGALAAPAMDVGEASMAIVEWLEARLK
jgi:hypothetical protein